MALWNWLNVVVILWMWIFFLNGFVDDEVFDEEGFLGVGGGGFVDVVVIV